MTNNEKYSRKTYMRSKFTTSFSYIILVLVLFICFIYVIHFCDQEELTENKPKVAATNKAIDFCLK